MKKIIKVDGMHCDKCVSRVKKCLESIDNIRIVDVILENKEVVIEYDNNIDLNLIKEKIDDLGFEVIN